MASVFHPHPSLFPVSFSAPYLLLLSVDCRYLDIVHTCPEISPLLSCSHSHNWEPTWRPITLLDNARHKSSIGLSDTWGLSTRGNMLSSILLSSLYSLSPFLCSFLFAIYELVQRIICCIAVMLCHIPSAYLFLFSSH